MDSVTFVALLLVVCFFGLGVLAFFFLQARREIENRFDDLSNRADSLDERTIHEFSVLDKKIDQIRTDLEEKTQGDEETNRRHDEKEAEILEKLEEVSTRLSELGSSLNEKLADEISPEIENLAEKQKDQDSSMEKFQDQVDSVAFRNDLQLAYTQLVTKHSSEAEEILQDLLQRAPDNKEVVLLAVETFLTQEKSDLAMEVVSRGLESLPADPDLLAELAKVERIRGNRSEQARVVAEGLVRNPAHPRLLHERALLHYSKQNYQAARDDLEEILSKGVLSAEILYNLGAACVSLGDLPSAMNHLRKSVSLDPFSADANHALGLALMHGDRHLEAVDFLERARELRPDHVSIRVDLSAALRLSGSLPESLRECAVAKRLDPKYPRIAVEEALTHYALSELREALNCLDNHLNVHPENLTAMRLKARILEEADRLDESIEMWRRMIRQSPQDADLHASLGEVLKRSGDERAALHCLEAAARMAPNSTRIQLLFAREALAQQNLNLVQNVVDYASPKATSPKSRLQFIEIRILLVLKSGKWSGLNPLMKELQQIIGENPDVIPVDKDIELEGEDLIKLSLSKEAHRIHQGLLDLYDGETDYEFFDELVTEVMRSLLPPKPAPAPATPPQTDRGVSEKPTPITPPPSEVETGEETGEETAGQKAGEDGKSPSAPAAMSDSTEEPPSSPEEIDKPASEESAPEEIAESRMESTVEDPSSGESIPMEQNATAPSASDGGSAGDQAGQMTPEPSPETGQEAQEELAASSDDQQEMEAAQEEVRDVAEDEPEPEKKKSPTARRKRKRKTKTSRSKTKKTDTPKSKP